MDRIDKRIALLKKFQDEMDHRIEIEDEAYNLICQGKYEEANELLKTLDDSIIKEIGGQLDALPVENANHAVQETREENLLGIQENHDGVDAMTKEVQREKDLNKNVIVENDIYFHYDIKMPDGKNLFSIAITIKELQLGGKEFEKIKKEFDLVKSKLIQNGLIDEVIEYQKQEEVLKTDAVLMCSEQDVGKSWVYVRVSVEVNISSILLDKIRIFMTEFAQSICSLVPAQ